MNEQFRVAQKIGLMFRPETLLLEDIKTWAIAQLHAKSPALGIETKSGKVEEWPKSPLYVTLTKNERSEPISFQDIKTRARFFIDVKDWAGGLLSIVNCREGSTAPIETTKVNTASSSDSSSTKKVELVKKVASSVGEATISKIVEVIQGDKFVINIDEPHQLAGSNINVNLRKVDAPDVTKSCPKQLEHGLKVKNYVTKKLANATSIKLINIKKTNTKVLAQMVVEELIKT